MASAGVPRAVSAQKGQTKGAIRHPCTLDAFKTLNLIQIKTGATDNKKPRRVKPGLGLILIAGETPDDQGFRDRKRLTLGSALRQADDACLTSPRHHEARMPTTNLNALLRAPAVVSVSR